MKPIWDSRFHTFRQRKYCSLLACVFPLIPFECVFRVFPVTPKPSCWHSPPSFFPSSYQYPLLSPPPSSPVLPSSFFLPVFFPLPPHQQFFFLANTRGLKRLLPSAPFAAGWSQNLTLRLEQKRSGKALDPAVS